MAKEMCDGCKDIGLKVDTLKANAEPVIKTHHETRVVLGQVSQTIALVKQSQETLARDLTKHMSDEMESLKTQRIERRAIALFLAGLIVGFVIWTNQNITQLKVDLAKQEKTH